MHGVRIEDIEFFPRVPVVRLVLTCLVFGILGWAFVNETWFEFQLAGRLMLGDLLGAAAIGLMLSRRRWICVPLLEYRSGAHLFSEIRKRLPVEARASDKQLALLEALQS